MCSLLTFNSMNMYICECVLCISSVCWSYCCCCCCCYFCCCCLNGYICFYMFYVPFSYSYSNIENVHIRGSMRSLYVWNTFEMYIFAVLALHTVNKLFLFFFLFGGIDFLFTYKVHFSVWCFYSSSQFCLRLNSILLLLLDCWLLLMLLFSVTIGTIKQNTYTARIYPTRLFSRRRMRGGGVGWGDKPTRKDDFSFCFVLFFFLSNMLRMCEIWKRTNRRQNNMKTHRPSKQHTIQCNERIWTRYEIRETIWDEIWENQIRRMCRTHGCS